MFKGIEIEIESKDNIKESRQNKFCKFQKKCEGDNSNEKEIKLKNISPRSPQKNSIEDLLTHKYRRSSKQKQQQVQKLFKEARQNSSIKFGKSGNTPKSVKSIKQRVKTAKLQNILFSLKQYIVSLKSSLQQISNFICYDMARTIHQITKTFIIPKVKIPQIDRVKQQASIELNDRLKRLTSIESCFKKQHEQQKIKLKKKVTFEQNQPVDKWKQIVMKAQNCIDSLINIGDSMKKCREEEIVVEDSMCMDLEIDRMQKDVCIFK